MNPDSDVLSSAAALTTPSHRAAPWPVVVLTTLLVAILGVSSLTVVRRAGQSGQSSSSLSDGFLAAAQAKTNQVNDFAVTMTMKLKVSGQTMNMKFVGETSRKPMVMSLDTQLPGGEGSLQERVVNHALYMHLDSTNVKGKHWVGYRLPNTATAGDVGQNDPLSTLQSLAGAKGGVDRV